MTGMLDDYFQQVWDSQEINDQHTLRDEAFKLIDEADYGDALYEALLRSAYAFMISPARLRSNDEDTEPAASTTATASEPSQPSAGKPSGRSRPAGQANSAKSSKFAQARKRWPMMMGKYSIAENGLHKNLESMSADEVLAAASIRRKLGEGNLRRAEWLEKLAQQMIKLHAATPMKLPADVLDEFQQEA